ncbi:MAG TPA: VWA domain-containing protein, partial [Aggregatilineales bacterium]|nr:VWA domain-containing protein [Aggregatilineales bacterium]
MSDDHRLYSDSDVDFYDYQGGQLLHNLVMFGHVCRVLGMDISPNRMIEVAQALELIHLAHKQDVYHVMKSMIVTRRQDIPLFDEAFKLFWRKPVDEGMPFDLSLPDAGHRKRRSQFLPPSESSPGADTESIQDEIDPEMLALIPVYSEWEALRHRNFADMTGEEIAAVQRVITKLPKSLGFRRSRRYVRGKGRSIDARGVFRENIRYSGNPIILPTRKRKIKPRPVVLICDISGSMERYTRVLLHFMHTLTSSMFQVETFLYSTHLTRITHPIRQHSID